MQWSPHISHFKTRDEKHPAPLRMPTSQAGSWHRECLQYVVVLCERAGWSRLQSLRRGAQLESRRATSTVLVTSLVTFWSSGKEAKLGN